MDGKNKSIIPITAGILLILSGILAIIVLWIPLFYNEQYIIFGIIGCILSIFPILAGILSIKRKLWMIALIEPVLGCLLY